MKSGELKRFSGSLKELPTLPPVALKLIDITRDNNSSFQHVARIIETDQTLTSRILKLANSPAFGLIRQIQSVERAIAMLGLNLVRSMALSIAVVDLFKPNRNNSINNVDFWRHCAACAAASERLAKRFAYPQPQEAFIAGLLHDLGKLVFSEWDDALYTHTAQQASTNRVPLIEAEESHLGMGHNRLGKILMDYWHFPALFSNSAWLHHQPVSHFGASPREELPFIVKCANNLCHIQRFGNSGNRIPDMTREELEAVCGLSPDQMADLSSQVFRHLEEISGYFNWDGCTPEIYLSAVSRANQELAELHLELTSRNRRIEEQQAILQAICRMQEALPAAVGISRALEKVVEQLAAALPHRRLMCFLIHEREGVIEGCLKAGDSGRLRRMVLPLEDRMEDQLRAIQPREQFSLIEKAVLRLGEGLEVAAEIAAALRSANLIVLPLEAGGLTIGQILIELESSRQATEETFSLLRQYARAAFVALERILLFEALEQQADDLARTARQGQEIQKRLYQAERLASVGRLAAGAAHEINNPLAAISAQAQLMLRRAETDKDKSSLGAIIDQCNRISKIIRDLMGFARPAEPRIEPTPLQSVIEHTLGVLENRIRLAGVEIQKEFEPDLPLIYADSKQLEQVFLNLTINALQAMPSGGALSVQLKLEADRERLRIEFADTGTGIDKKDLPSVFDPFYTTKKEGEGTGLGLAICHTIIESHQGEITVDSAPGKGTTFTILLPLGGMSEVRKIQSELERGLRPAARKRAAAGSLLIVDDEEVLRTVMLESLAAEGYDVDYAVDGAEGLDKLGRKQYDVMLLDLRMPKMEGMEVLAGARQSAPRMPVIVISGLAHEREFQAAQQAGAFACIKKPFEISDLLETVQKAIKAAQGKAGASTKNRSA